MVIQTAEKTPTAAGAASAAHSFCRTHTEQECAHQGKRLHAHARVADAQCHVVGLLTVAAAVLLLTGM